MNPISRLVPEAFRSFPPPKPEEKLQIIGDIHGSFDLLEALGKHLDPAAQTVFVGDYIDRGLASADVLRVLHGVQTTHSSRVVCLMGNHERMLLDFLEAPEKGGKAWLRHGGLETLASYGITGKFPIGSTEALRVVRDALEAAMGPLLIDWLANLPTIFVSGNVAVTHGGADPDKPLPEQTPRDLLWGHPKFASRSRSDGIWVAHGHTIVPEPVARSGRISIDTGAYATGRLTAAVVEDESIRFLTSPQSSL